MTIEPIALPAIPTLLSVREFFLGRQPILDRSESLIGYELLFRNACSGPANITNDLAATAAVIAHASQLGLKKVVGHATAYVNVDAAVLLSDIVEFLPRDRVVLEIIETVKATPEILDRITQLTKAGFRFALDDVTVENEDVKLLLPLVEIVKIDLNDTPQSTLTALSKKLLHAGKKLLAEKVEEKTQFEACLALGFEYFQGYFFSKPVVLSGKKISPAQFALIDLVSLIGSDADNVDIERAVKKDVALCFNLLRLVNTPAVGARHRIESIGQALTVLGRNQFQRWLQIMLYAEPSRTGQRTSPLLSLATTRGKLLELIAQQIDPRDRSMADTAFTVGIMSLMDTLFSLSMSEILDQIAVIDEVADALLHRKGRFGEMLRLAEQLEQPEGATLALAPLIEYFQLTGEQLSALQLAAYEWSDAVTRAA